MTTYYRQGLAKLLTPVCFCLLWAPVAAAPDDHNHVSEHSGHKVEEHVDENEHGNVVALSRAEFEALGGVLDTAGTGTIISRVTLPGEVHLNREAVAHITPRFPAKLMEVRGRIGDRVKAGQILARAESSETLAHFNLTSPISGSIIERHATLGEHLMPSDTAFVVADLSVLWVDVALYSRQVANVSQGLPVVIEAPYGPEPVKARVDYVAPTVDEHTRTGLARVFLDNRNREWKPGMFVDVSIELSRNEVAVAIPATAIVDLEGVPVVFVETDHGWLPQPVTLGHSSGGQTEILSGLAPGAHYVADGGFLLKAELQKSEFDTGHNH